MGYSYRNNNQIKNFWPDNTEDVMYFDYDLSFDDLSREIKNKWPDALPEEIKITAEHIHTRCLNYDMHNPSDWTDFIVITRK